LYSDYQRPKEPELIEFRLIEGTKTVGMAWVEGEKGVSRAPIKG
jgi:hypothetical protein